MRSKDQIFGHETILIIMEYKVDVETLSFLLSPKCQLSVGKFGGENKLFLQATISLIFKLVIPAEMNFKVYIFYQNLGTV